MVISNSCDYFDFFEKKIICDFLHVDFGLATYYIDPKTGMHVEEDDARGYHGSPRYMSPDAHIYSNQGRRDDLQSLGYVLKVFTNDSLPWDRLGNLDHSREKNRMKFFEMKKKLNLNVRLLELWFCVYGEGCTYFNCCFRIFVQVFRQCSWNISHMCAVSLLKQPQIIPSFKICLYHTSNPVI